MLEYFVRCSIQCAKRLQELGFGQIVGHRLIERNLRSSPTGNEQMDHINVSFFSQVTSKLERDNRSHAVTKENHWDIFVSNDCLSDHWDQGRNPCQWRFVYSAPPTRKLNGANFNAFRKKVGPLAKSKGVSSSIRKAEKAQPRFGISLRSYNPLRSC